MLVYVSWAALCCGVALSAPMAAYRLVGPGATQTVATTASSVPSLHGKLPSLAHPRGRPRLRPYTAGLPDADMAAAIGDGCHADDKPGAIGNQSLTCQCSYAAARAERSESEAGTRERQALVEKCVSDAEPENWPDKSAHMANAVTLHAKAMAADSTLPPLEQR